MSELDPRCQAARVWISAAVDGEATEAERGALRTHLGECAACRSWAALAESVSLQVRTSAPLEPERPFAFPVPVPVPAAAPARRPQVRAAARLVAAMSAAAAAAAVVAVLLSGGLQRPPTPGQVREPASPVITVAFNPPDGFVAGTPASIDSIQRDRVARPSHEPRNRQPG